MVGTIEVTVTDVTLYSIDVAGFTSWALNTIHTSENADSLYLVYTLHFKNIDAVQKHTPNGPELYITTSYSINAEGHNIFFLASPNYTWKCPNWQFGVEKKRVFLINAGDEWRQILFLRYLQKNWEILLFIWQIWEEFIFKRKLAGYTVSALKSDK